MGKEDKSCIISNLSTKLVMYNKKNEPIGIRLPVTTDVSESNWLTFDIRDNRMLVKTAASGYDNRVDLHIGESKHFVMAKDGTSILPNDLKSSYYARCKETRKEKVMAKTYEDKIGQVVHFGISDVGDYSVLVEEADGSKVKGLVLGFYSCYPDATYPNSSVPMIQRKEFDLSDPDIASYDIIFRDATSDDKFFESDAAHKQQEFLKVMVDVKNSDDHFYQSLTFDVVQIREGSSAGDAGVYCDLKMRNITGFEPEGDYQNPYVVDSDVVADTLQHIDEVYKRYSTVEGSVLPDTNITYNITRETADNKTKNICSVSVPYRVIKVKGFDVFPISLPDDVQRCVKDTMIFMSKNEYQEQAQIQTTPKKVPTEFEDIAEKEAMLLEMAGVDMEAHS